MFYLVQMRKTVNRKTNEFYPLWNIIICRKGDLLLPTVLFFYIRGILIQNISELQRIKFFFLPVLIGRFLIHGFKNIGKSLLAPISGNQRNFKNRPIRKNKQLCSFGQPPPLNISLYG